MFSVYDDISRAFTTGDKVPFVDPLANMSFIGEIDGLDNWQKQVEVLNDEKFVRYFLHESTHYSSFTGAVGGAFSKLAISSYTFFEQIRRGQAEYNIATRDMLVYQFAWCLFEPLFEGLALFQEHDAVPGNSDCATNSTLFLTRMAFEHALNRPNPIDVNIFTYVLDHLRYLRTTSTNWHCGKEDLLKCSLHERPYYLLGYLAVKTTYQRLCARCPKLVQDPDLFVLLMNDFWFQDYKLERILLGNLQKVDFNMEAAATTLWLTEYIQDRWDLLFNNIQTFVDECEDYLTNRTSTHPSYKNVGFKAEVDIMGAVRYGGLSLSVFFPNFFKFRQQLRYSLEDRVRFECDGIRKELVLYSKFGTKIIPTITTIKKKKYLGTVEAFLSSPEIRPIVIITDGFTPVAIGDPVTGEWNEQSLVEKYDLFPAYPEIIKLKEVIRESKLIDENSELQKNMQHNKDEAERFVRNVYGQLAFQKNAADTNTILDKLKGTNLQVILSDELDFISKLTLWNGGGVGDLVQFCDKTNHELNEILEKIKAVNDKFNDTIFWRPFTIFQERYLISKL